jgi:O-antigen/teichoic acid export membrane protein
VPARLRAFATTIRAAAGAPLLREFLGFGSSSVVMQGSRVVSGLVVAGMLGPATWGWWYLLNLIVAYGALTQLGALNGMNREVPAALGRGQAGAAADLRRTALGVVFAGTGTASLVLVAVAALMPGVIALAELGSMLVLLLAHQGFHYAATSLKATTRFATVARLQFGMALIYPLFAVTGAWAYGLPGFIAGQVATYLVLSLLAGLSREVSYRPRLQFARARSLVGIGFPIMLVGLVHTLFSTVDRWVVAVFLGAVPLGHYSLAIMALGAVGLLPQVIAQQFYPRVAFAWSARGDLAEMRHLANQARRMTLAAVTPVVAVALLVLPPAVRAFLPEFAPGVPALSITMFVPVIATIGQGYGGILHMLDRQTWLLGAILACAVVNVAVSALLVGPLGLVGVAIGTLVAFACYAAVRVVLGARAMRLVRIARETGSAG